MRYDSEEDEEELEAVARTASPDDEVGKGGDSQSTEDDRAVADADEDEVLGSLVLESNFSVLGFDDWLISGFGSPKPSPPARSLPISSFLRPLPLRRRSLSLSSRPRRGAAGAVMVASPSASYASALADVALANNTLEATLADIEKLDRFFDSSVQSLFINPTIPVEKKREFIDQIAESADLQPHTVNFLNIIVDMRRTELIKDIVKEFEIAFNKITGTEVAVVTSVVTLGEQHLAQIAKTVQRFTGAKNVRIKTEIDPSLIAGFTIRYGSSGSKLIDMSVKKQLNEIASQLDFSEVALV